MSELIKSYGTLVLAIYGVIQVWCIALWRRYARKGKLEYYETGTIEIGYSWVGPTVALNGTLRGLNKDVFVRTIDLTVIREKDKSQHVFRWIAFRPPKVDLAGTQPIALEIPSAFLVPVNSSHRFNIVFNDSDLFEDIRSLFNNYIAEWYKVVEQLIKIPPSYVFQQEAAKEISDTIQNFRMDQIHVETYTALDRKCYWETGNYSLTVNVRTSKPDKVFAKNYRFSISDADSNNLRLNVVTILEEPISSYLKVQNYPYYFAYPAYKQ